MSTMRGYRAMTRAEFRLFRREPFSVVFVLAFPLMMMVLLAAVFGNKQADAADVQNGMLVWRGVTPANYYTAASVAGIVAALGLITLPINLAGYREGGILRRFHASSVSASTLVNAELTLALVTFVAGTLVMAVIARLAYGAMLPQDVLGVAVALVVGTAAFGAIGLLLATVIRTSRSAQGIGLLLFFALWLISGTAPPRAFCPQACATPAACCHSPTSSPRCRTPGSGSAGASAISRSSLPTPSPPASLRCTSSAGTERNPLRGEGDPWSSSSKAPLSPLSSMSAVPVEPPRIVGRRWPGGSAAIRTAIHGLESFLDLLSAGGDRGPTAASTTRGPRER